MANKKIECDKTAIESLLYGSKALSSFGFEVMALAHEICPEHYKAFHDVFAKHHNANCGPLHMYVEKLLRENTEIIEEKE